MTRIVSFAGLHAATALACLMTDTVAIAPAAPAPAAPPATKFEFEVNNLPGKFTFDVAEIPAETRLKLLQDAVRNLITNRVNVANQRYIKDEAVVAWSKYDEAVKTDPLIAAPTVPRPAPADLQAVYDRALADLRAGNVGRKAEGKPRERKDPLIQLVTRAVVKDLFDKMRAADPKASFLDAQKAVGPDGVAYLDRMIEEKVAQGIDRAALVKMRDTRYINPAKVMLGITENKATKDLPSIL